jgi:hypothetical protein
MTHGSKTNFSESFKSLLEKCLYEITVYQLSCSCIVQNKISLHALNKKNNQNCHAETHRYAGTTHLIEEVLFIARWSHLRL